MAQIFPIEEFEAHMPYTFNGCGTKFYGNRDKGPDGSYVCTEWITFIYIPLIPLRSLRVLPVGEGTNIIIHSSQSYRTVKVPLCWPQVRNIYLFSVPIILVIVALNWTDLKNWVSHDILKHKPGPITVEAAPIELPLDEAQAAKACGNVLKLEAGTFDRLSINEKMSALVKESNFTDEQMKTLDIEKDAFGGYAAGYVSWNKDGAQVRNDLVNRMNGSVNTLTAKMSASEADEARSYSTKELQMIIKAFDLGRRDGRMSPCRY